MNKLYKNRRKGGAPKKLIYQYLYPHAIGLYYAGFGVEPVSTTDEENKSVAGLTACFIKAILDEVEKSIDSFGFDEGYTLDQIGKLRRFKTTPAALRKNINKAMRMLEAEPDECQCKLLGIDTEEAAQRPRRPAWRVHAEYFEMFILNN